MHTSDIGPTVTSLGRVPASSLADKEVQDMGIVFDAAYSIYDVREALGHQLLRLRYPPGDVPRWKGSGEKIACCGMLSCV